ncbi:hypothetical protein [Cohnella laeviribosi]|uniref:hypothetical protein n=1 Tax=Cohnella laeviribosi TaxID=380174 RepID=UPI0012EBA994|nr:hypothetical protein [Cohnella laeviribosi]
MANEICINKYNTTNGYVTVNDPNNFTKEIGKIYYNEVFTYLADNGGERYYNWIYFKNSSGTMTTGCIVTSDAPDFWNDIFTSAYGPDYKHGTLSIDGRTYNSFPVRRTANIYTAGGTYWGSVAAGQYVYCYGYPAAGSNNPGLLQVHYVRATNGNYEQVSGNGVDYGFVDIGFAYGSGKTTLSVYSNNW